MANQTLYNVQKVTRAGSARYLAYVAHARKMEWTDDAYEAFDYEDRDEADADAEKHGGEVFTFTRPIRRA